MDDFKYPDRGEGWEHISKHDHSDAECEFAAFYIPSNFAEQNGAKAMWVYADGIYLNNIWTGILGGKPRFFKYKEKPHDR